ncbi:L,D-transpeptidase family protein [Salinarimonas soli]|uniref:L,D-transpeptidase family protein n=1 Tax=Salinarimonas soli TaxID=1638099 RepID=A0A5B2VV23_9HYPH|nr:L,D-transpeptidase family protein [Salinarimonas soli]
MPDIQVEIGEAAPDAAAAIEIAVPDLPAVVAVVPPSDAPAADIPPPDLPAVAVVVPPAETVTATPDIVPPDLPAVAVVVPPIDPVAAALRERLAEPVRLHPRLGASHVAAVQAFYAAREFRPLFVEAGALTPVARGVIARLDAAGVDALDPADYPVPALGIARRGETPADLAGAELTLAASALLYARDARGGRIEPARLSRHITPKLALPDAGEVLAALAGTRDASAALQAYNPPHEGYRALREKLREARAAHPARPMVQVPAGPVLRVGMSDARVPLVRARFGLDGAKDERSYDERLASAVATFQREHGMKGTGVLDRGTVAALDRAGASPREADLIANMERWRWLPADLGARHVFVDITAYTLRVVEDGRVAHSARVMVGKPERPTPIFSERMTHMVVNPSWTVPPTILRKDMLPELQADPSYAARRGLEVWRNGKRVDPAAVDWSRPAGVSLRQPPGERNALGQMKFMFPNDHAVYIHDTPSRNLFRAERRALSSGCVRVDQPFRLAEVVLEDGAAETRLKRLIAERGERTLMLRRPLPVHLAYFTLVVDDEGRLRSRPDIYGVDEKVKAALGLRG